MSGDHSKRVQRVQRELFESIAHFLQHSLPLPLPCHASVSAVDVTQDLSSARVFFRLAGADADVKEGEAILRSECGRFQKYIARELDLKFTPTLRFEFGQAPHLDEIDQLFANLRKPKFGDE